MSVNQGRIAGGFWGLVEQKGPWKSTATDVSRSQRSQPSKKTGGGIEIGGTKNAGHAGWYASINPQVDPNVLPSPPRPSQYVQKSIIVPSTMMPKTPKGTVLRNAPTETMRHEPTGVQKAGHNYVPHFQPSGEEAPRENETPSLMGETSVASDESMMDSEDYKAFEQRIYEATRPPQYEFATQTELKDYQDFGLQTYEFATEERPFTAEEEAANEAMYQEFKDRYFPKRPEQQEMVTQTDPTITDTEMTIDSSIQTDPIIQDTLMNIEKHFRDNGVQTDPEIVDTIMTLEKRLIDNGVQTGSDLIKLVQSAKDLKVPDAKKLLTGIQKGKLPEKKSIKQNPTYNFEQAKKEFEEYTSQNRSKQTKKRARSPEPSSSSRKDSKRARSPEPVKEPQGPYIKTGLTEKQVYELAKRKVRILKKKQEQGRLVSNLANQLRNALQFIDKYESKRK